MMRLIDKIDDTVYSYATIRQQEMIDSIKANNDSLSAAAKELGITRQA